MHYNLIEVEIKERLTGALLDKGQYHLSNEAQSRYWRRHIVAALMCGRIIISTPQPEEQE